MSIQRTWEKSSAPAEFQSRTIWDAGDEIWELFQNEIRHFRIISRVRSQNQIVEIVQQLPECPVPLEAFVKHSVTGGWIVKEVQLVESQVAPLTSSTSFLKNKNKTTRNKANNQSPQQQLSVNQTSPEQQKQSNQESVVKDSLQFSCNLPTELWKSLSDWIPPHALFQPSLHLQAAAELLDTLGPSFVVQKVQVPYSQPRQGQRPYGGSHQHAKPYRPKKFLPHSQVQPVKTPLLV